MDFQKAELKRILPENGWEIEILDNYEFALFSKETWKLRSKWSPADAIAYITFDLDPMEINPEKEYVWAISIRAEDPAERQPVVSSMSLIHWKDQLPDFLKALDELRLR